MFVKVGQSCGQGREGAYRALSGSRRLGERDEQPGSWLGQGRKEAH